MPIKPCRKADRKLLDGYHSMRCVICGRGPCDPSHIRSRGSGGPDEPWNVYPKCRFHHTEWGQIGWSKFFKKYPWFLFMLRIDGWDVSEGRLWNSKLATSGEQP